MVVLIILIVLLIVLVVLAVLIVFPPLVLDTAVVVTYLSVLLVNVIGVRRTRLLLTITVVALNVESWLVDVAICTLATSTLTSTVFIVAIVIVSTLTVTRRSRPIISIRWFLSLLVVSVVVALPWQVWLFVTTEDI